MSPAYEDAFRAEVLAHRDTFAAKALPKNAVVHLLIVPLHDKATLVAEMDRVLKAAQELI